MAKGDLFKRSLEAGTSFVDMTREKAEAVVKEWVEAGDMGKGRAKKAVDDLLERSRRVSDEMQNLVRREIGEQLAALGVATRADLARLEAKLDAVAASAAASAAAASAVGTKSPSTPPGDPSTATTPPGSKAGGGAPIRKAASRAGKQAAPRPAKRAAGGGSTPGSTT